MFQKWSCLLLCLTTMVVFDEAFSELPRDSPFLHMMGKHHSGAHAPRTVQWAYHLQEGPYRHASQGTSHGYVSRPHESALKSTQQDSSHEYPSYSISSQEYWRPTTASSNLTGASYYGYSRTHLGLTSATSGPPYQDSRQGSYSKYHFQQTLPATVNQVAVKKIPAYHVKGNFQVQGFDAYGKSKYKKTNILQSPTVHKKLVYPRVHKPYVKHKYPTRKTVHPLYRRFYQSPYQRYEIPSREMLRFKVIAESQDHQAGSTASPSATYLATSDRYHYTTERMDDAYPDGTSTSEDYSAYNDTHQKSNGNYYETYEEVERTTLEPEENSHEESTTRGYYGDRIYMSTQLPHLASDKANVKNKYFLVRRTSDDDDDIETIFE